MRRILLTLLSFIITISLLLSVSGCGQVNEKLSVKESLKVNYDALSEHLEGASEFSQVTDYLAEWADKEKIKVSKISDHYVVLSKPASENYKDADSLTLQCSISLDTSEGLSEDLETAAILLTTLYSAEFHGSLKAVFTEQKHGLPLGARELENSYLKGDNFISLDYAEDPFINNSIAATSVMEASRKLHTLSPRYTKAYRIHFSGASYKCPYPTAYPNAIATIGELLASCKSSGILFELARFSGGQEPNLLPKSATALVVVQENATTNFISKFEKSFEKVQKDYKELDESFHYTIMPAKLPAHVIQTEDTDDILSFLYTLINGPNFITEENEILADSNIGTISTKGHVFKVKVDAKMMDHDTITEMNTMFKTLCGLSGIHYRSLHQVPLWTAKKNSPLIMFLSEKLRLTPEITMENIDASNFLQKKPKLNLVICGSNKKDGLKLINTLLEYTSGLPQ